MEYITQHSTGRNNNTQQNTAAAAQYSTDETPVEKVARPGILSRVKYDQWHVINVLRHKIKNLNALNLAGLLAALARMDCTHYDVSQTEIANWYGDFFGETPTRQAVAKWEKTLIEAGLIETPTAAGRGFHRTKKRRFTAEFIAIANRRKVSDKNLHATVDNPPSYLPKSKTFNQTQVRAHTREDRRETSQPAREHCQKQKTEIPKTKVTRPPKFKPQPGRQVRKLSRFQNSISWWIWQNWNVSGPGEAVELFAAFLQRENDDDVIQQVARSWSDCTDAARPGLVSGLVKHLRSALDTERKASEAGAKAANDALSNLVGFTGQVAEPKNDDPNEARQDFRRALFGLVDDYSGPCGHIVEAFQAGDDEQKERILNNLNAGALDQFFE